LLRDPGSAATQSHTLSAAQYFGRHDALFLPRRLGAGLFRLAIRWHRSEHGLEAIPLFLAVLAAFRRRPFFGPAFATGFVLTVLACGYAAYNSDAGVRYLSGLAPFLYAYGFALVPAAAGSLFPRAAGRLPAHPAPRPDGSAAGLARWASGAAGIALILAPVAYPHRYYERILPRALAASGPYAYRPAVAEHLAKLAARVPPGGHYYAASLCQLNFLAPDRYCVGLQELYDPSWFPRSLAAFHPTLVALTPAEGADPVLRAALDRMRAGGYLPVPSDSGSIAAYLELRPAAAGGGP
jgi:hypothetical protein